ncbi:MAG TPA: amidase [Thermoleophilaceae bacterium]|nr:amidase [Thermoleophilaceae bacterium]
MDAFERHVRSGLELAGVEVDEIDLAVMRAADAIYGPALRALGDADLVHVWEETALDPSRPPEGSTLPEPLARPSQERAPLQGGADAHPQDLGLREQAALVASGDLDPAELLAATLERIAERDGPINSVVDTFPDESERMLAEAPRGPLHGVPVGVKDQFALPWRAPMDGTAREALPAGDSGVHRRLREAGAVIACVTNMHFWGGGSTGHLSAHGPCGNPWNPEHCGGGSSGGSAAAVGARLVAGAAGADGGGSIRLPAAYCGITGIKPTFGSVPTDGNVHGYLSMDCAGPMCRDAADTRLLGEVLTGMPLPAGDGAGLRAGLVRSPFWEDLDPEVEAACRDAIAAAGWETTEIEIDHAAHAQAATVLRLTLEGMPSLEPEDIADADPVMRALVKFELLLPAHLLVRADRVRSALRRSVAEAFGRVDVLVWPTVPAPAPRLDNPTVELPSGIVPADSANVRQAGFGNLTGIPGVSVPVGLHSGGLPIGLMIQAPWGADARVLDAAEHLEDATGREFVDRAATLAAA